MEKSMYLIREIMHCKPGKAKEMVAKFKELSKAMKKQGYKTMRIYTDMSGERYWTVVAEWEIDSLDKMAEASRGAMMDEKVQKAMSDYHGFVEWGTREIYKVEQ